MSQAHATKESVHRWDLTTFNEPSICDACSNVNTLFKLFL
jgi:hypothetical protein